MKKVIDKLLGIFGHVSANDKNLPASERRAGSERRNSRIDIPAEIVVCRKPEDIPRGDVVSGTEKGATIHLKDEDAPHVLVFKQNDAYTIMVSAEIYQTPQAKRIFEEIRESLAAVRVDRQRVAWATVEIVEGARNRKPQAAISSDTLATSKSKYAEEFAHWLETGMGIRATDMHVEQVGEVATMRYRVDGALEKFQNDADGQIMGDFAKKVLAAVYNKLIDAGSNTNSSFNEKTYFSSTVTYDLPRMKLQLRCQNLPSVDGFDFVARFRIERENAPVMTYKEMGLTPSQIALIEEKLRGRRGLMIIAGIPNSGKTTLVQAMLTNFPDRHKYKFVTLDDPVEFKVPGVTHATVKSVPGNPEESARYYTQAVESWLRGNPDVFSLGEVRNAASGNAAITTSRVGCLGFATIHANSLMGIYERLTDNEIGLSIRAITSDQIITFVGYQALVPLVCQVCALSVNEMPLVMQARIQAIHSKFGVKTENMRFSNGVIDGAPCSHCGGRGTHGMKAVAEMYSPTEPFLKALREGDDFGARDIWLSESDGRFDTDDMTGKPIFLHAFKDAIDGKIDIRTCERFGSFESYTLPANAAKPARQRQTKAPKGAA